jgi:hypothetical protein
MAVSNPERQQELRERVNMEVNENITMFIKNNVDYPFEHFENVYDEERERPKDIFEYYSVSNFLYEKLKEHGQPVAEIDGLKVWGRTTTGQAVYLDYAIDQIFE